MGSIGDAAEARHARLNSPPPEAQLYIYECGSRDFFESCTIHYQQWIEGDHHLNGSLNGRETARNRRRLFERAEALYRERAYYCDKALRQDPRVGYDVLNDSHLFIFKLDHAGWTYVVSEFEMNSERGIAEVRRLAGT